MPYSQGLRDLILMLSCTGARTAVSRQVVGQGGEAIPLDRGRCRHVSNSGVGHCRWQRDHASSLCRPGCRLLEGDDAEPSVWQPNREEDRIRISAVEIEIITREGLSRCHRHCLALVAILAASLRGPPFVENVIF